MLTDSLKAHWPVRRLPDIRMAPGARPEMVRSALVRGIASLPVVFTPERKARPVDEANAAADAAFAS